MPSLNTDLNTVQKSYLDFDKRHASAFHTVGMMTSFMTHVQDISYASN